MTESYGQRRDTGYLQCYRHPDRPTLIRCQRCDRPICTECQIPAAVGVQCPECVRAARPPRTHGRVWTLLHRPGAPVVTYAIIAVCVLVYVLQWLIPGFTSLLVLWGPAVHVQPWRIVTSAFAHSTSSLLHLPLNMYTLWLFGTILEPMLGRARFTALYAVGILGGSLGAYWLDFNAAVLGASGALFALMGALLVLQRRMGGQYMQLIVLIGINLVFGFITPGIAWQAHLGGLVIGAIAGLIIFETRRDSRKTMRWLLLGSLVVLLAVGFIPTPFGAAVLG